MAEYKNPELLVSTDWVLENKDKSGIIIIKNKSNKIKMD